MKSKSRVMFPAHEDRPEPDRTQVHFCFSLFFFVFFYFIPRSLQSHTPYPPQLSSHPFFFSSLSFLPCHCFERTREQQKLSSEPLNTVYWQKKEKNNKKNTEVFFHRKDGQSGFRNVANHPLHRYRESERNEEAVERDQAKKEKEKKEKQKGAMWRKRKL